MRSKQMFVIFVVICGVHCQRQREVQHCGRKFEIDISERIFGGVEVKSNAWPWLVAFVNRRYETFFCGGNLISSKHVISAAHCFKGKWQVDVQSPQDIAAHVGKHNLSINNEPGSTEHLVWEIILHPDWDSEAVRFDADISVVVLRDPVDLSGNVEPICLPRASNSEVVGTGTVVGWGKSEHSEAIGESYDSTPNELEVSAVNQSHCFLTVPDLVHAASHRTFCTGFVNLSKAPCTGDSGGGFYLRNPSTELFELKGIVSASFTDIHHGCKIEVYSLYMDVAKFVDWIRTKVRETKEIVWKKIELDCTEGRVSGGTQCSQNPGPITRNLKIRPNFLNHRSIKTAAEVMKLELNFSPSTHIFSGIGESFERLKTLWIIHQEIKFIDRQDFVGLSQLKGLLLYSNQIEFLPKDVFWDLSNLDGLWFGSNPIEKLPKHIFKNLKELRVLSFDKNKISYFPKDLFANNLKLREVWAYENPLKTIDFDFTKVVNLNQLDLHKSKCIDFKAENEGQVQEAQQIINQSCK